jgi:hypothetical protein
MYSEPEENWGDIVNSQFQWQQLYRAALLEVRTEDLDERIAAAEKAIQQRIAELRRDDSSPGEEYHALDDALRMLRAVAVTECKAPGTTGSGSTEEQATSWTASQSPGSRALVERTPWEQPFRRMETAENPWRQHAAEAMRWQEDWMASGVNSDAMGQLT